MSDEVNDLKTENEALETSTDKKDEEAKGSSSSVDEGSVENDDSTAPVTGGINDGLAAGDTDQFKWYIAKTMTGQENKVTRALKERIVNYKLTGAFAQIISPEETVVTNTNGKKRTIKKKFFPGYVLIKMVMNDKTWHLVKNTEKITGFVGGTADKPTPISEDEATFMSNQMKDGFKKPRTSINFTEGETVKVTEGPFASFVGTVEAVNEKGKIRVNVSIFGRPTPVELDFTQVEKVS